MQPFAAPSITQQNVTISAATRIHSFPAIPVTGTACRRHLSPFFRPVLCHVWNPRPRPHDFRLTGWFARFDSVLIGCWRRPKPRRRIFFPIHPQPLARDLLPSAVPVWYPSWSGEVVVFFFGRADVFVCFFSFFPSFGLDVRFVVRLSVRVNWQNELPAISRSVAPTVWHSRTSLQA